MRFLFILSLSIAAACSNPALKHHMTAHNKSDKPNQLIFVSGVVCDVLKDNLGRERIVDQQVVVDSIVNLFVTELSKLSEVSIEQGDSLSWKVSPCFQGKWNRKNRNIHKSAIIALAPDEQHAYLIPILYVEKRCWLEISSSLSGGFSGGGLKKATFIRFSFFVVENKQITYASTVYLGGKEYAVDSLSQSQMNISEYQMSEVVKLFSRNYLKEGRKKSRSND